MNITKIFFSFALVIVIAISSAVYTIFHMKDLTENTKKLYTHPFKVSNAISNIQTAIITMHRSMKDIVSTGDKLESIKIIESIQHEEEKVYKNFELIYKNYLGSKKDIDVLYKAFKAWRPMRENVIYLMHQNKIKEAVDISKRDGEEHINNMYKKISVLKEFALDKADELYNQSINNKSVDKVVFIFTITLFLSIMIAIYIVNNLLKIAQANNKQLHLIDQNILTATISLDRKIEDISNALCYVLNKQKKDLINTSCKYFFTNEEEYVKFKNKIYAGKEHKSETYILIDGEKIWFDLEVLPELDSNFELKSFNLFLNNISDKKRIEEVSITDTLTGLNNRNYFEMIFEKEVRRAKRDKKSLSILMFDIDYFKQYNDTYGHQEGDRVLKAVAQVLSKHTNRSYDYAFRIGGEEFFIISYQKDFKILKEFAQTILTDIESLKISHKDSNVSKYITVSAGVIEFGERHLLNTDDMFKAVDTLLYEAKKDGRNNFKSSFLE